MLPLEKINAKNVGKFNFKLLYEMPFHGNLKIFAKNHHHIIGTYIEKIKYIMNYLFLEILLNMKEKMLRMYK